MSNQDGVREARLFRHELQGLLHFVDFIDAPAANRAADWPTPLEAAEWLLDGIEELEKSVRQGRSKSVRPADEREVKEWIVKLLTAAKGIKQDVTEGKDFRARLTKFRALAADGVDLLDSQNDVAVGSGYVARPKRRGKSKHRFTDQRAAFAQVWSGKRNSWAEIEAEYRTRHPEDRDIRSGGVKIAHDALVRKNTAAKSKRTGH